MNCNHIYNMDVKEMISLVESQPVIWDKCLEDYKNRNLTCNAWREVCRGLRNDFDSLDAKERNLFVNTVAKKWKNIRDTWVRAQRRVRRSSNSPYGSFKIGKKYVFQDHMSFLHKNGYFEPKTESDDTMDDTTTSTTCTTGMPFVEFDSADDLPGANTTNSSTHHTHHKEEETPQLQANWDTQPVSLIVNQKCNLNDAEDVALDSATLKTSTNQLNQDRHLLFFKSLLPSLHHLDEEQTLEFHLGVLKLLQDIRKPKLKRL